jgi:predicted aconitase with swiveling domain
VPEARTLAPGEARGEALVLDDPLSFWGGVDALTGRIIDSRHPQRGAVVAGRVLVLPSGRGSSSSSSVLAECVRADTSPAAIVLFEADPIIALGAIVAAELYGAAPPVVVLPGKAYGLIRTGDLVSVRAGADTAMVEIAGGSPGQP